MDKLIKKSISEQEYQRYIEAVIALSDEDVADALSFVKKLKEKRYSEAQEQFDSLKARQV